MNRKMIAKDSARLSIETYDYVEVDINGSIVPYIFKEIELKGKRWIIAKIKDVLDIWIKDYFSSSKVAKSIVNCEQKEGRVRYYCIW